jgi:putative PIN family toxin of toxin-antitoxin system
LKVVLDTNVLVSGLLSPSGPPAVILDQVAQGKLTPCFSKDVFDEYLDVVFRPKLKINREVAQAVLDVIMKKGKFTPDIKMKVELPDPDDVPFVLSAKAAEAEVLITGNLKDFPKEKCHGVAVMSPTDFLLWKGNPKTGDKGV